MPKNISLDKLVYKLRTFGFHGPYPGGKHFYLKRENQKLRIPNPHKGDISKSLLSKILRQTGISSKDWGKIR